MTSRFQIKQAAQCIHAGGVIAYPTESVFGLGCDPMDELAVNKILSMKQRPVEKGLILIASNIQQLKPFINITSQQQEKLEKPPARPTTWLVPVSDYAPFWIRGNHQKIAVRLTQHPLCRQLCDAAGFPLVSTSANPGGLPAARTSLLVHKYFADRIDYYLAGNLQGFSKPSEIRDLESDEIIRSS